MKPISFYGNSELNVLYFSDVHAKTSNIQRFKTAVDCFDRENKGNTTLKLAGGDLNTATAMKTNVLLLKLMDLIGLDASSVGNHDLRGGSNWIAAINAVKPKFKFLAANLEHNKPNLVEENIAKSTIIKKNGEKVGVIGVSPLDYGESILFNSSNDATKTMSFEKTLSAVKQEVQKLEKKGINKIFLLAHTGQESQDGTKYYKELANLGGIDVIIGGHDHIEYDDWFISKRGEPVKVVSVGESPDKPIVGEDLDSFGTLKTVFNEKGVLIPKKCKNTVELTSDYPVSKEVLELEEQYLQTKKIISSTDKEIHSQDRMKGETPLANLCMDSMLWMVNQNTEGAPAEIAIMNPGAAKGSFPPGEVTVGHVIQSFPYTESTLIKAPLTKKQIVEALEVGAKSVDLPKISPGVMQVGGLRYTITDQNEVKDVFLLNEDGTLGECLDEQDDEKVYNVAYDKFLMTGIGGLSSIKKDENDPEVEFFPYSLQDCMTEYLQANYSDKKIEVQNGRIVKEADEQYDDSNVVRVDFDPRFIDLLAGSRKK